MHRPNHAFDMRHIFSKWSSSQFHTYFLPLQVQKVTVRVGQSRLEGNKTSVVMYQSSNFMEASELNKEPTLAVLDHCLGGKSSKLFGVSVKCLGHVP